jgi:pimeloyl-ACP methyl ester carboxylesterase
MAHFILVHGAWQGAWVWEAAAAGLRQRGHQVRAPDLPGSGADQPWFRSAR